MTDRALSMIGSRFTRYLKRVEVSRICQAIVWDWKGLGKRSHTFSNYWCDQAERLRWTYLQNGLSYVIVLFR